MNPLQRSVPIRDLQDEVPSDAGGGGGGGGGAQARTAAQPVLYFERTWPRALIFGSFFAVTAPLIALRFWAPESALLSQLMVAQAVGLGTTHFFVTLAVYLRAANLRYFASSWAQRLRYFGLPLAILASVAFVEALPLRTAAPQLATAFYFAIRFADFFHVGRQHVGMLQIWKRGAQLQDWTRSGENAFFVGMALLQWQTHFVGGQFAADQSYAILPACALLLLWLVLVAQYLPALARAQTRRSAGIALLYFSLQTLAAAAAVYQTALYLLSLSVHFVEYHVIMAPRSFSSVDAGEARSKARSRWLQPVLLYAGLVGVVLLFEQRNQVAATSLSTRALVHAFDGIFLLHYVLDAFLWKFRNPYYRQHLPRWLAHPL